GDGGLQGIASKAPPPRAIVLGSRSDPACAQLRQFLQRNQISFSWVRPDAPDAVKQWEGPLPPETDCPAIRLAGGETVVRPVLRSLAKLLGLSTEASAADYDTIVIGAGPTGIHAAAYAPSPPLTHLTIPTATP